MNRSLSLAVMALLPLAIGPLPAQARSPSLSAVAAWAGCPCRRSTSARHR